VRERWRHRLRYRLKIGLVILAAGLLLAFDFARLPRDQVSARALLGAIHLYQATLSPHMGELGVRCRFTPTCSHYGAGAIEKYGAWKGSWLAAWRVLRCGPWTPMGTYDPP
jgi:putative membrane protein insertion efficiency factor